MNKVQLQRRLGIVSNISRLELYGSAGGSSNLGSDTQSWVEIFGLRDSGYTYPGRD